MAKHQAVDSTSISPEILVFGGLDDSIRLAVIKGPAAKP